MTNSVQDEFISTVSHEMRTPLTSIRGFSQTLLASWDKLDDDSKKKFVKIIEEQSNRLINLVENILTVSKINVEQVILKSVNVNEVIKKSVKLIELKYKEHKFIFNLNMNLPNARLDEDKFAQIIINLAENACKYSDKGTDINITTSFTGRESVLISIKDNGAGIDLQYKDKIFDKFVRVENHLTSTTQGNGLGLYITKNLVELMNGKIWFESKLNEGSEFFIEFPFYNQEDALKCSQQS